MGVVVCLGVGVVGVLVGVTTVVGGCGWFYLLVCRVSLPRGLCCGVWVW